MRRMERGTRKKYRKSKGKYIARRKRGKRMRRMKRGRGKR